MLELPHAPDTPGLDPVAKLLAEQLELVGEIFERQLASDLSAINTLCVHIEAYRGKMLRPTLVLLSGLAATSNVQTSKRPNVQRDVGFVHEVKDRAAFDRGGDRGSDGGNTESSQREDALDVWTFGRLDVSPLTERHAIAAAVVEMIHMATLVHDDVLDEAEVRRRGATVNHLWGNEAAVMLGDYLISNAFHLCSTMGDPEINLSLGKVTNTLCEGELIQLHHRNDFGIDEETYFEIVRRKTASLIGECCRLGAALSGADDEIADSLRRCGVALGIAFQIQDDLLDLIGDQRVLGKSLGKDLAKGKLTLPVTHLMRIGSQAERGETLRIIQRHDIEALRDRLVESGSVDYSRTVALEHVSEAKREIARLPENPARDLLNTLADTIVKRSH